MDTTKLYLAAALISLGAGVLKIDKSDPRHMEFHLSNSSPIVEDEDEWFYKRMQEWENKSLTVNAQEFVDAIQYLKSEVHKP